MKDLLHVELCGRRQVSSNLQVDQCLCLSPMNNHRPYPGATKKALQEGGPLPQSEDELSRERSWKTNYELYEMETSGEIDKLFYKREQQRSIASYLLTPRTQPWKRAAEKRHSKACRQAVLAF